MTFGKKGALFHWIIFGVIASLGLFFMLSIDTGVDLSPKGEWQTDFLENYVLAGEKEVLKIELQALSTGEDVIGELARVGGFPDASSCGSVNGIVMWNSGNKLCFPKTEEIVKKKFMEKMPNYEIFVDGSEVAGKGKNNTEISLSSDLKEKAFASFSSEERECLSEDGKVPVFGAFGGFDSCQSCPEESCSRYRSRFYCDVDPCSWGCVGAYKDNVYSGCMACPEDKTCEDYIDAYHCSLDPCSYGCNWNVNRCEKSDALKRELSREEKITIAKFPEQFSLYTKYFFTPSFRVNIGNAFEKLQSQSLDLLGKCKSAIDLKGCLEGAKLSNWKFSDCSSERFASVQGKVPFCVNEKEEYRFGLDFS